MIFAHGTSSRYRLFNVLVGICLATMLAAVGLLYFWLFDRRPVVDVFKVEPVKPVFIQGEPIVIHWEGKLHRLCDGDITRYVFDREGTMWPLEMPVRPVFALGHNKVNVAFSLPRDLPPGRFEYRAVAVWRCNPLSSQRQMLASISFTVVPAPLRP